MAKPEIELVELVHIAALARIGLGSGLVARSQWRRVNPLKPDDSDWLLNATRTIVGGRQAASEVTTSFLRLMLALETGTTFGRKPGVTSVSVDDLRKDFIDAVERVADFDWGSGRGTDTDLMWLSSEFRAAGGRNQLGVEELVRALTDWQKGGRSSRTRVRLVDGVLPGDGLNTPNRVQEQLRALIRQVGAEGFAQRVARLKRLYGENAERYEKKLTEAFDTHSNLVAGLADSAVMDRSRRLAIDAADWMGGRVAVARGTRGNPCGFCAMLASRGFIYLSERSAIMTAVGKRYHPNCHCFPIMRVTTDDLPERNKFFQEMWPEVTKGHYGADARRVWRKWADSQRAKSLGGKQKN